MPRDEVQRERAEASEIETRVASPSDLDGLVDTLAGAFEDDPVWRWAFPKAGQLAVWWRFIIASALRYEDVWIAGDYAAVSVWIPPDGTELTREEAGDVESLLQDLVGTRTRSVVSLLERFESSHPREQPHYYLSLLGVRPDNRGKGLGMALLAENLKRLDALGVAAYLESSNPANDRRYEGVGFQHVGTFTIPGAGNTVATMWRDAEHAGSKGLSR